MIHDERMKAETAQPGTKDSRGEKPVGAFLEKSPGNRNDEWSFRFEIYKSKAGIMTENYYITLAGEPQETQYGVTYKRSKTGNKINKADTYIDIGADKWEQKKPDLGYIVNYIKRSVAAKKLPFP